MCFESIVDMTTGFRKFCSWGREEEVRTPVCFAISIAVALVSFETVHQTSLTPSPTIALA